jgi:hypothetical protein
MWKARTVQPPPAGARTVRLTEIAQTCGFTIVRQDSGAEPQIARVYAGDRVSDLLNEATPGTLLVTGLGGAQLLRLAELMDVSAICLVNGASLAPDAAGAAGQGAVLLVSPVGMFETCGRIYRVLYARDEEAR